MADEFHEQAARTAAEPGIKAKIYERSLEALRVQVHAAAELASEPAKKAKHREWRGANLSRTCEGGPKSASQKQPSRSSAPSLRCPHAERPERRPSF